MPPRSSHHCFGLYKCLCFDVELCSLKHAHFLYRANIDNRRFPSNRFDKATHVRTEQMRSVTEVQNTQKRRVASDTFRCHISVLFWTHLLGAMNASLKLLSQEQATRTCAQTFRQNRKIITPRSVPAAKLISVQSCLCASCSVVLIQPRTRAKAKAATTCPRVT